MISSYISVYFVCNLVIFKKKKSIYRPTKDLLINKKFQAQRDHCIKTM